MSWDHVELIGRATRAARVRPQALEQHQRAVWQDLQAPPPTARRDLGGAPIFVLLVGLLLGLLVAEGRRRSLQELPWPRGRFPVEAPVDTPPLQEEAVPVQPAG